MIVDPLARGLARARRRRRPGCVAAARAHVTASRCLIGRPVTRFCGFKRSTLSLVHRQDQIDRLALAPCPSRRRDRGTSAGTARPRAPRVASSSSSPFHSASPIRVPSASRPTYQVNFASRISVSGSISTSTASRCAIQRSIASPSACKPAPAGGEIERDVELVAVLEIMLGVVVVHHVDLGLGRNAEHRDQRRDRRARSCRRWFPRRRRSASPRARSCAAARKNSSAARST